MKSKKQREREEFLELVAFWGTLLFTFGATLGFAFAPFIYRTVMGIVH